MRSGIFYLETIKHTKWKLIGNVLLKGNLKSKQKMHLAALSYRLHSLVKVFN